MSTEFRPIPNHTRYEVSTSGEVRRREYTALYSDGSSETVKSSIIKPFISNKVLKVHIDGKDHLLHRLVAITHVPNPDKYKYVRHIDGDLSNNNIDNLEWYQSTPRNYDTFKKKYGTAPGTRIRCITDGNVFISIKRASMYYGIEYNKLCYAISRKLSVQGRRFEYTNLNPTVMLDSHESS